MSVKRMPVIWAFEQTTKDGKTTALMGEVVPNNSSGFFISEDSLFDFGSTAGWSSAMDFCRSGVGKHDLVIVLREGSMVVMRRKRFWKHVLKMILTAVEDVQHG